MFRKQIQTRLKELQKALPSLQRKISNYPKGNLICTRNGNSYKWYQSDGHNIKYIPKKERTFAELLVHKKYKSLILDNITCEIQACEAYLKLCPPSQEDAIRKLTEHPGYMELLSSHFTPKSQEFTNWANSPYERNTNYPTQLIHKTISGNCVRSKSEAMIATFLHTHQIPFRYECKLLLGDSILYPDFTIRHPVTGEIYYWEHFGLMDDPSYIKNVYSKLQLYTSYGLVPTIHLITTFETKTNPLTSDMIEKIIRHYFL